MNRRELFKAVGAVAAMLGIGVARPAVASEATRKYAKNGIISPKRTPWMLGCKVFVDGVEIKYAKLINVAKGYVTYMPDRDKREVPLVQRYRTERVYGYIEVEAFSKDVPVRTLDGRRMFDDESDYSS